MNIILKIIMLAPQVLFSDQELVKEWESLKESFLPGNKFNAMENHQKTKKFFDGKVSLYTKAELRMNKFYESLDPKISRYVISSIIIKALEQDDEETLLICLINKPYHSVWNQKTWYTLAAKKNGTMFNVMLEAYNKLDEATTNSKIIRSIIQDAFPKTIFSIGKDDFLKEVKEKYLKLDNLDILPSDYNFVSKSHRLNEYGIEQYIKYFLEINKRFVGL